MQYLITFLEGLISFLSPCMLPMLPVYLSYFAGNADKNTGFCCAPVVSCSVLRSCSA